MPIKALSFESPRILRDEVFMIRTRGSDIYVTLHFRQVPTEKDIQLNINKNQSYL